MDDAGPQSLFVVVSWCSTAPYSSSIIQLETQVSSASTPVFQTEFSAHIPHLPQVLRPNSWVFSLPPASSTKDLYMFPVWISKKSVNEIVGALPGFIFNLSTKKCKTIKPPLAPKYTGHVVTMGDHIYFMAQPHCCSYSPDPRFERYDTLSQSWEEREPLSRSWEEQSWIKREGLSVFNNTYIYPFAGFINGTAVLDDTILFNIDCLTMWAYNVGRNKWYPVKVLNNRCFSIEGVAVVLNKIIFALAKNCRSVVALTLKSQEIEGDVVFTCDLHKEYVVPGLEQFKFESWDSYWWTRHLVHLGKGNFCVVRSCNRDGVENQYIQLTNIEVSEKTSIVKNICVHEFKIPSGDQFTIEHCFLMPKRKTTALKEGKRSLKFNLENEAEIVTDEAVIVTLPPELLQCQDKYSSQRNIIDEQGGHTTPEVQEDVAKKSSASVVGGKSNVPSKASTISAVTGHQYLSYAKPSSATKASALGDGASGKCNTDEEGHSIYVRNLSLEVNFRQVVKGLKKFGPIKSVGIHTEFNNMSECFADVEFERATSKQNAIEASLITIGGRLAVISEKRGTGLTQVDSNRSSSSDRNKFKNHGEDSRFKTTSDGHKDRRNWPKGPRK